MVKHSEGLIESLMEKISEKIHAHDSFSSSDSDLDLESDKKASSPSSVKAKIFRLFGRERPVHHVFGGGKRTVASALTIEINRGFTILRNIASGKDLKKFLIVIAALWALSIMGNWCNFLTLFYISFVLLHTVPVLYEKYEDKVDPFAEKALIEIKKQYVVLSKIPVGALKSKRV